MTLEHSKIYRIVNKDIVCNCFHIKGLSHHFKIRPTQGRKPLVNEKCSLSSFYPGDREMGSIDSELLWGEFICLLCGWSHKSGFWGLWVHMYILKNKQTFFITVQGMPELNSIQKKKNLFNCIRVYALWLPRIWGGEKEQEESLGATMEMQTYTLTYVK